MLKRLKRFLILLLSNFLLPLTVLAQEEIRKMASSNMPLPIVWAQEAHQHDSSEKLGQVNFPVSCNAIARKQFNRALALLHSFQYPEAEQAFSTIGTTDPTCAMRYWGVAMSI